MLEERVAELLQKYLGDYVEGLSKEALKISVWQGNVELRDLRLKQEALNALKLPIKVKAGFIGSIKLKVPWSRLGKTPVLVHLDRLFVLAESTSSKQFKGDANGEALQQAKQRKVRDAETAHFEGKSSSDSAEEPTSETWISALISTIIGNLQLSISNVHIRYEDSESHPGHPSAAGFTLAQLAAFTVNEDGKEIFVTSGALDRVRKSVRLGRAAIYFSTDQEAWKIGKGWDELDPTEWSRMFEPWISSTPLEHPAAGSDGGQLPSYILNPVNGMASYSRLGRGDPRSNKVPRQRITVSLDDVSLNLTDSQYRDVMKLVENVTSFNRRLQYAQFRPTVGPQEDPAAWWRFASKAVLKRDGSGRNQVAWRELLQLAKMRKKYLATYVRLLQANPEKATIEGNAEIEAMDRELDSEIIIQWRLLAHTFVQQVQGSPPKSWWTFMSSWGKVKPEAKLADEDWKQLNGIIGYEPGMTNPLLPGEEPPHMLHTIVKISMARNGSSLAAGNPPRPILELEGNRLVVGFKIYPRTIITDVSLMSYGIKGPEGVLVQSAKGEEKAITVTFSNKPLQSSVDWALRAHASTCFINVRRASVDRVTDFFQSEKAVSPSIALETAAALQVTLDEVAKNAQAQFMQTLKARPKFSIDLDIHAPKITVPTEYAPDGVHKTKLLLDLGHFTLTTDKDEHPDSVRAEGIELYMHFKVTASQISAFLVDGDYDWLVAPALSPSRPGNSWQPNPGQYRQLFTLVEQCGLVANLQHIWVPHANYPRTRIAVRIPSLGFNFSGGCHHRLQEVMYSMEGPWREPCSVVPWDEAEKQGPVVILTWQGIANRDAMWKKSHGALAGPFLYLLTSPLARSYKQRVSLLGKQVVEVPPEQMGDEQNILAVCDAGHPLKVADPTGAVILKFDDDATCTSWRLHLSAATYRASAMSIAAYIGNSKSSERNGKAVTPEEVADGGELASQEKLFLTGALDELTVRLSGVMHPYQGNLLLQEEKALLVFHARRGKVELAFLQDSDLLIGFAVASLDIEDCLAARGSPTCQYLVRSYLVSPGLSAAEIKSISHQESVDEGTLESVLDRSDSFMGGRSGRLSRRSSSTQGALRREGSAGISTTTQVLSAISSIRSLSSNPSLEADPGNGEESFGQASPGSPGGGIAFYDTLSDLAGGSPVGAGAGIGSHLHRLSRSNTSYYDAEDFEPVQVAQDKAPPGFEREPGLLPCSGEVAIPGRGQTECRTFVKGQYIKRTPDSSNYDGNDMQLVLQLATLSFFCNRPTVMSLMDLVADMNASTEPEADPDKQEDLSDIITVMQPEGPAQENVQEKPARSLSRRRSKSLGEGNEANGHRLDSSSSSSSSAGMAKGILGRGKQRVIFRLVLQMENAQVTLNREDGLQLAMLTQEKIGLIIKVFPATFKVEADMGNLRICDYALGEGHMYGWMFDTRDVNATSFVKLDFTSFHPEDPDYEGYDYHLQAQLARVRIVILNRFIQEVTAYFTGLAPKESGDLVKLKQGVSQVERSFTQSEIKGQPAVKLDLAFSNPVVVLPRSSHSRDFLKLDLREIYLNNSFGWLRGSKDSPEALHVESISIQLEGIHLFVAPGGALGPDFIQQALGLSLVLRRPLRDLWHELPSYELIIKLEKLAAGVSDHEFEVLTGSVASNFSEAPHVLPPVKRPGVTQEGQPTIQRQGSSLAERPSMSASGGEARGDAEKSAIFFKVRVDIQVALLGLYTGHKRDIKLAGVQVQGLWLIYASKPAGDGEVMVSVPRFVVKDYRASTSPELRYVVGNADEMEGFVNQELHEAVPKGPLPLAPSQTAAATIGKPKGGPSLTMLVLDYKYGPLYQEASIRIQRPRLLVALDFLTSITTFFVPSFGAVVKSQEAGGRGNNPMEKALLLKARHSKQKAGAVTKLSRVRPLLADSANINEYIFDGCQGLLRLEDVDGSDLKAPPESPLIIVGHNKHLIFKNVRIQNGEWLDASIHLGNDSSYSAHHSDGVTILASPSSTAPGRPKEPPGKHTSEGEEKEQEMSPDSDSAASPVCSIKVELQAVGAEFTFFDSTKWPPEVLLRPESLLRAKTTAFCRYTSKGADMELMAMLKGTQLESSTGLSVVDPFDMHLTYTQKAGMLDANVNMSGVTVNLSFSVLRLLLRLEADYLAFMNVTSEEATVRCTQFDRIWFGDGYVTGQQLAFWRPRAPPGFAIMGDCVTSSDAPPSQVVVAINIRHARVKRPLSFQLIWSSSSPVSSSSDSQGAGKKNLTPGTGCSVWLPIAPEGFMALGCVASRGQDPPPLGSAHCVLQAMATPVSVRDCIFHKSPNGGEGWAFWRVENLANSFFCQEGLSKLKLPCHDLRAPLVTNSLRRQVEDPALPQRTPSCSSGMTSSPLDARALNGTGRMYRRVSQFRRIWISKHSGNDQVVSIWRPLAPPGYAILGDIAVSGYDPPAPPILGLALRERDDGLLATPVGFTLIASVRKRKGMDDVFFWEPQAPPGYKAMGMLAGTTTTPPGVDTHVRCMSDDGVQQVSFAPECLWSSGTRRRVPAITLWPVENKASTFMVSTSADPPEKEKALGLLDLLRPAMPETINGLVDIARLTITIFDDFGGLMAPLVDATLKSLQVKANGRPESFNLTLDFSVAATSFNGRRDAWEPLVENFDASLRYQRSTERSEESLPGGSQLGLSATTPLNWTVSTASLNMLLEGYASWTRLVRIEDDAKRMFYHRVLEAESDEAGEIEIPAAPLASAFSQNRRSYVVKHNRLGHRVFVRVVDVSGQPKIFPLASDSAASVFFPPRRILFDPSTKEDIKRLSRRYVAIRIGQAEFAEKEGLVEQEYVCLLRLMSPAEVDADADEAEDDGGAPHQTARTRCQCSEGGPQGRRVAVTWDEVFIFEISPEMQEAVHISVLNHSTGAVVGSCSWALTDNRPKRWKIISTHIPKKGGSIPWARLKLEWTQLTSPSRWGSDEGSNGDAPPPGQISTSHYFFMVDGDASAPMLEGLSEHSGEQPGTLQVGFGQDGPWAKVVSSYVGGAMTWNVGGKQVVVETSLMEGVKHVLLRSLVVVANETDLPLEVALCPSDLLHHAAEPHQKQQGEQREEIASHAAPGEEEEAEVFENQRYQPLVGWGSKWLGHLIPGYPAHWSDSEGHQVSQEFTEPPLPPGWAWKGDWAVDRRGSVDHEGWAYGLDFRSVQWPPSTPKARIRNAFDFTRRRRWIRIRQYAPEVIQESFVSLGIVKPGETLPLPASYMAPLGIDYCLQVRPHPPRQEELPGGRSPGAAGGVDSSEECRDSREVDMEQQVVSVIKREVAQKKEQAAASTLREPGASAPASGSPECEWGKVIPQKNYRRLGRKAPPWEFRVQALTETEELLCCQASPPNDLAAWLQLEASATSLGTDRNQEPIKDWRITVRPPLILENLLPVPAAFTVFLKKSKEALQGCVVVQGTMNPGEKRGITSVNPKLPKGLYLSWLPRGDWKPASAANEVTLISHPFKDMPSSISLVNQKSGRKLSVSIEHDFGAHENSPHVVQLYVPCWIDSAGCPPLAVKMVELDTIGLKSNHWLPRPGKRRTSIAAVDMDASQGGESSNFQSRSHSKSKHNRGGASGADQSESSEPAINGKLQRRRSVARVNEAELPGYPTMISEYEASSMGIAVALQGPKGVFGPPQPLADIDNEDDKRDMRAMDSDGVSFRLSVSTEVHHYSVDKIKVIKLRPHITFTNRLGETIFIRQENVPGVVRTLEPSAWRAWALSPSLHEPDNCQLKVAGCDWSFPFPLRHEGTAHLILRNADRTRRCIQLDTRTGDATSRFVMALRRGGANLPYRLENRSAWQTLLYRQAGLDDDSWQVLKPCCTAAFTWEQLGGKKQIELMPRDELQGSRNSSLYSLDQLGPRKPLLLLRALANGILGLAVQVYEEGPVKVVHISDWKGTPQSQFYPGIGILSFGPLGGQCLTSLGRFQEDDSKGSSGHKEPLDFELFIDFPSVGLSVVDHRPQELLYLFLEKCFFTYGCSRANATSRLKLAVKYLQLDNQLPLTTRPVLLAPESGNNVQGLVLEGNVTFSSQPNGMELYQYIGVRLAKEPWLISIHEPIIWRLVEMYNSLHLDRLGASHPDSESSVVQLDPDVKFEQLNLSGAKLKLTLETSPGLRPRGLLGIWGPLVTTLGNTIRMPISLSELEWSGRYMRRSSVMPAMTQRLQRELVHQPLRLLSGVDYLGVLSSAFSTVSKGAATLSTDKAFLALRAKQDMTKRVEGFGDGILYGAEALARGLYWGATAMGSQPTREVQKSGIAALPKGIGKGAAGMVLQPISGILDMFASVLDGLDASIDSASNSLRRHVTLRPQRLPRAVGGSSLILAYDEERAKGQMMMRHAESGAHFGQHDIFRNHAKYAYTDAYECHMEVPHGRVLMITTRRVMLLQRSKAHKAANEIRAAIAEPCIVVWEVPWSNVMALEASTKPEIQLIVHIRYPDGPARRSCPFYENNVGEALEAVSNALKSFGPDRQMLAIQRYKRRQRVLGGSSNALQSGALSSQWSSRMPPLSQRPSLLLRGAPSQRASASNPDIASLAAGPERTTILFDCLWSSEREESTLHRCAGNVLGTGNPSSVITIWRSREMQGYVYLGDVAVLGFEPPTEARVYEELDDRFALPLGFDLIWRNLEGGMQQPLSIWMPRAPKGYEALGAVVMEEYIEPDLTNPFCVRCVKRSLLERVHLAEEPVWHCQSGKYSPWGVALYNVGNKAKTFIALRERVSTDAWEVRMADSVGQMQQDHAEVNA